MSRAWQRFALVAALLSGAGAALVPVSAAAEPSGGQGRQLYTSYCARCHGVNMVNTGVSFDLRTFPRDDKERFLRSVRKGLRAMPAWEGRFETEELDSLWLYVSSGSGNGSASVEAAPSSSALPTRAVPRPDGQAQPHGTTKK